MQLNTLVKLGGLAFGVVQDEKIQELFKIAHNGAKRRGLLTSPQVPPAPTQRAARPARPQIPFAPGWNQYPGHSNRQIR